MAPGKAVVALVCMKDAARTADAVDALSRSRPEVKVLVTTTDGELDHLVRGNLRKVSSADMVGDRLETEIARLRTLERVQALRDMLDPADDIALLLQPDPDPDGIASALALRQILRRNRATAPIVTFGGVSRPENVAMLDLLEIDLEVIRPEDLGRFGAVALLDVQPNVFRDVLPAVDVVIDHHPEQKGYQARFRDIRASYGATSTILTEYCLAAEVVIPQRLATALLYGIKSDTLFLDRETSRADIAAFSYLYPLVNTNLLRRIEKPELPRSAFAAFARALQDIDLRHGLAYVHLGAVEREDVIPQMAELSLQLRGGGVVGGERPGRRPPGGLGPQRRLPEGRGDGGEGPPRRHRVGGRAPGHGQGGRALEGVPPQVRVDERKQDKIGPDPGVAGRDRMRARADHSPLIRAARGGLALALAACGSDSAGPPTPAPRRAPSRRRPA